MLLRKQDYLSGRVRKTVHEYFELTCGTFKVRTYWVDASHCDIHFGHVVSNFLRERSLFLYWYGGRQRAGLHPILQIIRTISFSIFSYFSMSLFKFTFYEFLLTLITKWIYYIKQIEVDWTYWIYEIQTHFKKKNQKKKKKS